MLALVEIAVAFAIAFLAFGKDERPAPPEEHVLGAAPRAAIQALHVALVFGAACAVLWPATWGNSALRYTALCVEYALPFVLPIYVEARGLGWPPSARRDAVSVGLVFTAGVLALPLAQFVCDYSEVLLRGGSHVAGLGSVLARLQADRDHPDSLGYEALGGLVFVLPALARLRRARPKAVLLAGLAGAVPTGLVCFAVAYEITGGLGEPLTLLPVEIRIAAVRALALSLGGAFSDKLLRRLEARR